MELNDYIGSYDRFLRRYERIYAPKISREIKKQILTYLDTNSTKDLTSDGVFKVINKLHLEAGSLWSKKTLQYLRSVKKARDPRSLNEYMWSLLKTYMIMDAMNSAEQITQTTIDFIKEILYQATIFNWSVEQIRLRMLNSEYIKMRGTLITRTELTYATNYGSYIMIKDMGFELRKKWVAVLDGKVRRDHRVLNNQRRSLDEPFEVVNKFGVLIKMNFPGDRSFGAGADQICNCRCFMIYE